MSLNLKEDLKRDFFKMKLSPSEEFRPDLKSPRRKDDGSLVILQHPIQGNMVITKDHLDQFKDQIIRR